MLENVYNDYQVFMQMKNNNMAAARNIFV